VVNETAYAAGIAHASVGALIEDIIMKIIKNEKLIKRNGTIGQYLTMGALLVLAGGMYISLQRTDLFIWSLVALVAGFIMTQIGMFYTNRFGRHPRPDEQLDTALKGLPGDTVIYHFMTPVAHVLVGAPGIWILEPRHQRGKVTHSRNRWRMTGGGFIQAYMSLFGQEGLGRPDADIANDTDSLRKYLEKRMEGQEIPPIQAAVVFTSEEAEIDAPEAPSPTLKLKQLKEFMRQRMKERPVGQLTLAQVKSALGGEATEEEE
jgi:hypothetical protein